MSLRVPAQPPCLCAMWVTRCSAALLIALLVGSVKACLTAMLSTGFALPINRQSIGESEVIHIVHSRDFRGGLGGEGFSPSVSDGQLAPILSATKKQGAILHPVSLFFCLFLNQQSRPATDNNMLFLQVSLLHLL